MGISLQELRHVLAYPRLKQRPLIVLDVGSQNLHGATPAEITGFVRKYCSRVNGADLRKYAEALSLGAKVHPVLGGMNGAWLGELLERVGIKYVAIDIFSGYQTKIFDLNNETLAEPHVGAYDLVLNCGTTEHVLNQINSFRVIHEATKVGGLMYHSLPMTGFLDHGYFNYNPRLFIELARANSYAVRRLSFRGPFGLEALSCRLLNGYSEYISDDDRAVLQHALAGVAAPTTGLSVLLEKTVDRPFKVSLETSTTVGSVEQSVGMARDRKVEFEKVLDEEKLLTERLQDPHLKAMDIFSVYQRRMEIAPGSEFPLVLEKRVLELFLADDPERPDLDARLMQVKGLMIAKYPLLRFQKNQTLEFAKFRDAELDVSSFYVQGKINLGTLIDVYHCFHDAGRVEDFPLELERDMLEAALKLCANDAELFVRLGQVLSAHIPKMPLRRS
jgi:hypothetical protein